jgi:hypothetical protein
MSLSAIGMLLYARAPVDGSWLIDVLPPSLLVSMGIGLSFVPVTIAAVAGVAPQQAGLASGLINTSRQMGGSIGLAVLATVATARTEALGGDGLEAVVSGYHRAFEVGAAFAALAALSAALLLWRVRRPRGEPAMDVAR